MGQQSGGGSGRVAGWLAAAAATGCCLSQLLKRRQLRSPQSWLHSPTLSQWPSCGGCAVSAATAPTVPIVACGEWAAAAGRRRLSLTAGLNVLIPLDTAGPRLTAHQWCGRRLASSLRWVGGLVSESRQPLRAQTATAPCLPFVCAGRWRSFLLKGRLLRAMASLPTGGHLPAGLQLSTPTARSYPRFVRLWLTRSTAGQPAPPPLPPPQPQSQPQPPLRRTQHLYSYAYAESSNIHVIPKQM